MKSLRSNRNATPDAAPATALPAGKAALAGLALALVLCLGAWGANAADPVPDNPHTTLTAQAVDEAVVAVVADHAYVTVDGQVVSGTGFKAPVGKPLAFAVDAEDGYAVASVQVQDVYGNAVRVQGADGDYAIEGADVADGLTIEVQTQAQRPNEGLFLDDEDPAAQDPAQDAIAVTLVGQNLELAYDGNAHTVALDILDADGQPVEGYFAIGEAPYFTNVTDGAVQVDFSSYAIYDENNNDVTSSFDATVQPGSISIEPAVVSIATPSSTKVYDGTPLTADELEMVLPDVEEFMEVAFTIAATGSQTGIGQSTNTYSIDWGSVNPANYRIEETLGTLTVTANEAPIVITMRDVARPYDGTPLTSAAFDLAAPSGYTAQVVATGSQTDVGTASNAVASFAIFDAQGNDVTSTFADIATVAGTLTVEPAELTVATPSASKSYDGSALVATADGWMSGLVAGETATARIVGSQTDVGSSLNNYTITWDGTAKQSNYRIVEDLGVLEVTAAAASQPQAGAGTGGAGNGSAGASASAGTGAGAVAGSPSTGPATVVTQVQTTEAANVPVADNPNVVYLTQTGNASGAGAGTADAPAAGNGADAGDAADQPATLAEAAADVVENLASALSGEDAVEEEILYDDATPLAGLDSPDKASSSPWIALGAILLAALAALIVLLVRNRRKDEQEAAA